MKSKKPKTKVDERRRRRIKAALAGRGIVATHLARKLGVNQSLFANVIAGRKTSRRVIAALVAAGVPESYFKELRERKNGQVGVPHVQNG